MKMRYSIISLVLILAVCSLSQAATKVLEWKFDGNTNDTSGNGINGIEYTMSGDPVTYDTGINGQALVSDGNQCAYVTGVDTSILPVLMSDTWTVNVWVYAPVQPLNWRLAWCLGTKPYYGGSGYQRCLYSGATGLIVFADLSATYVSPVEPWDIGQWQMVTTTFDGTDVRVYKNGVMIGKRTFESFEDAAGEVRIPSNYGSPSYPTYFKGKFDEFTIWRGALSQQEIIDLMPDGVADTGPAFELAHYTMGDLNLTTNKLPDHSGKGKDGNVIAGYASPVSDWIAPGAKSACLAFAGAQDINTPAVISRGAQYSIAFWLKGGWQPYNTAFYEEFGSDGSQFIIRGDAGTNGAMKVYSKDKWYSMEYIMNYNATALLDGREWHHLAVVVDGNAMAAKWYMDGELVTSTTFATNIGFSKTAITGHLGYSTSQKGYLGSWDRTYIDDVHLYRGILSQADVQMLMEEGNINNDFDIDYQDLAVLADEWLAPSTAGGVLTVGDFESSLTGWSVYPSSTYTGTGTISQTTNAFEGNGALRWDYDLPALVGGNYTAIVYDLGANTNLTGYDLMKLQLYKHSGNTSESMMFVKFIQADNNSVAEAWIQDGNCVVNPVNEWDEWYIDMNRQFHKGSGYVKKNVLTSVRYVMIGCGGTKETARTGRIDIDEIKMYDFPLCSPYLTSDFNSDCKVNFRDYILFADSWILNID